MTSDHETVLKAYYEGRLMDGLQAAERILSVNPSDFNVRNNRRFYVPTLDMMTDGVRYERLMMPQVRPHRTFFNPSCLITDYNCWYVARSSDYVLNSKGEYLEIGALTDPKDVTFHTDNIVWSGTVKSPCHQYGDVHYYEAERGSRICGAEDLRLYLRNGELYASATTVEPGDRWLRRNIVEIRITQKGQFVWSDTGGFKIERTLSLDPQIHEKNWMPIIDLGGEHQGWIYSINQRVVLLDRDANVSAIGPKVSPLYHYMRGGTQALYIDGRLLFLAHEVCGTGLDHKSRIYVHRLCEVSANLELKCSAPFRFSPQHPCRSGLGVEFACGFGHHSDGYMITFGSGDESAWRLLLRSDSIDAIMNYGVAS